MNPKSRLPALLAFALALLAFASGDVFATDDGDFTATATVGGGDAGATAIITKYEWRMTRGALTSVYKFHPDYTWEESWRGETKTGRWQPEGGNGVSIGHFRFELENNGAQLRRSDKQIWKRGAALASAAGAADLAPQLAGFEWRLAIGQNTSVYIFYSDHTWEENYKHGVKGGRWRQTGAKSFSVGAFQFHIEDNGAALRRSDNKIWQRAAAPAPLAAAAGAPDIVPAASSPATPNYWCTWWSQADGRHDKAVRAAVALAFDGDQGNPGQRDGLNEEIVFGKNGWAGDWPGVRGDLFLVLDDGWDVPYGLDSAKSRAPFGSCIPDDTRWPSLSGKTPAQKLKLLNDRARAAGWRGLGLWLAVQTQGETGKPGDPKTSLADFTAYWKERVLWCREAGIEYWKADWGVHNHEPEFRRAMTALARQYHPALIIEHAVCMPPINGLSLDKNTGKITGGGRFENNPKRYLDEAAATLAFSDVLRTYDIVGPTVKVTTLDRAAHFAATAARLGSPVILNLEDSVCEAAALACSFGAMRGRRSALKNEVVAAARWARIAPAVPVVKLPFVTNGKTLRDTSDFSKVNHWYQVTAGKKGVYQTAPAVIARGLPPPKVTSACGGGLPYVLATLHPNGALAVCAAARAPATGTDPLVTPPADIEVDVECINRKIGLFGAFNTISFPLSAKGKIRVWAQDLIKDQAVDITNEVRAENARLTLPGAVLQRLRARASAADLSMPAAVVFVEII
ncbi:MAG: hypothetical protein LBI02_00115 [Opitutaceae bacterium]|jgi:hypothetical protein|nr:hypothetical protein [Opitutaceae bacterium]